MSDLAREISREMQNRRNQADDILQERKQHIYSTIPQIDAIDTEISMLGIRLARDVMNATPTEREGLIARFENRLLELKAQKSALLQTAGYDISYLEPVYTCRACSDTGYIEQPGSTPKMCSCLRQLRIDHAFSQSNMHAFKNQTFEHFDISLFPDISDESRFGTTMTPRQNMLIIKELCEDFVRDFDTISEKGLFFCGNTGTGKTFMANCVATAVLMKGKTVLYQTAPELFNLLTSLRRRAFNDDDQTEQDFRRIYDADLLVIDDLGTESSSPARFSELFNLINSRTTAADGIQRKTIISTNYGFKELIDIYTDRIMSRMLGSFKMCKFIGYDLRHLSRS